MLAGLAALVLLTAPEATATAEREPISLQMQTYLVAPATDGQWLFGAEGKALIGRFGVTLGGYQQALYGPPGTTRRLGSLLVGLAVRFELSHGIALGAALGVNSLFVAPDVASIAPSAGFFGSFRLTDWLTAELAMDAAAWPHYRLDGLSQVTAHWRRLTFSAGARVVHLEAPPRLGLGVAGVTSIGAQVGLGVEWSG